jgi:hypothetical protein
MVVTQGVEHLLGIEPPGPEAAKQPGAGAVRNPRPINPFVLSGLVRRDQAAPPVRPTS